MQQNLFAGLGQFGAELVQVVADVVALLAAGGLLKGMASEFKLRHDMAADLQRALLIGAEGAGHLVDHRKGAEGVSIQRDEGRAGVEADLRLSEDERIVGETRARGRRPAR